MAKEGSKQVSLFMWLLVASLLSQSLVIPVLSSSFEAQKNYYPPDPHAGSPPTGSHGSPHHGSPPTHHESPPTHHGGSYNPTPSTPSGNCGTPPSTPTPTPSNPTPTPYYSPPTVSITPPTPEIVSPPTPPTPEIVSPPTPPTIDPGTPSIPSPPYFPEPNSPFSCNYWRTHPTVIWGLLGWWGTMGNAFGVPTVSGFGSNMSLLQALSNTRTDGFGSLYREGTASWLNSLATRRFPFTTKQVRDSFLAALHSDRAAASQAQVFKLVNEGHLRPRD